MFRVLSYCLFLQGTLPSEWLYFDPQVTHFNVALNRISGTIPAQYFKWRHLVSFSVESNKLSGTLSSLLGLLTVATYFDLTFNYLSGSIPTEISLIGRSVPYLGGQIELRGNKFSGYIPSEVGLLSAFQNVHFRNNLDLSGTMPSEMLLLTKLNVFAVSAFKLSGTIDARLGDMTSLDCVILEADLLSGTLPPQLSKLTKLGIFVGYSLLVSGMRWVLLLQLICMLPSELSPHIPTYHHTATEYLLLN
jgi:hypothetical protein